MWMTDGDVDMWICGSNNIFVQDIYPRTSRLMLVGGTVVELECCLFCTVDGRLQGVPVCMLQVEDWGRGLSDEHRFVP